MSWLVKAIAVLVVLIGIVIGLVVMIPSERIAQMAADKFKEMTGRELVFSGDVSPRFWPVLGVTTGPVTISNADWSASGQPMLAAQALNIDINAAALIGGEVKILGLSAERPVLNLERAKDGRENWVFGGGGSSGEISVQTPGVGKAWSLETGAIRNGTLRFIDAKYGQDLQLDGVDLTLEVPQYDGAFGLELVGLHRGQKIALDLQGEVFSAFEAGREVPLQAEIRIGGSKARFEGRGGWHPTKADGVLTGDLADMPSIAALLGTEITALPEGLGAQKLKVSGSFSLREGFSLALSNALIEADDNILRGDVGFALGADRPKVTANLAGGALSFLPVSAQTQAQSGSAAHSEAGWSKDPIDVSSLAVVDAQIALAAESLSIGVLDMGRTRMGFTLDRSRAVFELREMVAYGGSVAGEFVLNGRGNVSVGGKMTLANIQAQNLLRDLLGWQRLIAQGNLSMSFLGEGRSLDAIMKSLSGQGNFSLGKGELQGLDLIGMLRNLDVSYVGEGQRTIFDGVGGSFKVAGGNLTNDDLRLVAPYLSATGQGRIGLGARDLDYALRPTAFVGNDGAGGVMVPLRITGSWARPTYRLDLETIARQKMEAEAKALEQKAKAKLESKLQQELGIIPQEGQGLEDNLKREGLRLLEGLLSGN